MVTTVLSSRPGPGGTVPNVRRAVGVIVVVIACVAFALACGRYDEADEPVDAGADAVVPEPPDAPTTEDVEAGDASDAGVDACKAPCDCDGDGDPAIGACGGGDCNDNDPRVSSTAGFVTAPPNVVPDGGRGTNGDWNCDNVVEKEGKDGVSCAGKNSDDCLLQVGYVGKPGCGEAGSYITCKFFFVCGEDTAKRLTKVRSCR